MRALIGIAICLILPGSFLSAGKEDVEKRLRECGEVLQEILDIPEGIPPELLDKAECLVIIPSVKKFAFGFGGSYGRGAMLCRSGKHFDQAWGPPAMYRLEGGSFGLQLGGSATDFVLLVMNSKGARSMMDSQVKLGADAIATAGPKGRSGEASTDAYMNAEILSYSRSKGLFAGISLQGSTLRQDKGANKDLYGRGHSAKHILTTNLVSTPEAARKLVDLLQQHSPRNLSE